MKMQPHKAFPRLFTFAATLLLAAGAAHADSYSDTVELFRNAGASAGFFRKSYAYAVFPTVGEAGFIVGGAGGKGRVFVRDKYVGDTTVGQVSVGFQLGGGGDASDVARVQGVERRMLAQEARDLRRRA